MQKELKGYWGVRTATIDWCEINYEVTHYIAEFWNTISNLVMIVLPLYGIYWCLSKTRQANQLEKLNQRNPYTNGFVHFRIPISIIFCHIGLILVGIGSWMFHMTLLYPMQLLDELPMIYGSGMLIYTYYELLISVNEYNRIRARKPADTSIIHKLINTKSLIFGLIFFYCVSVTIIYLFIWKDAIFHEIAYSLMVLGIVIESFSLIKKLELPKRLYLLSLFYYLFGFFLWNVDNNFCAYLKEYRGLIDKWIGFDADNYSNYRAICFNVLAVSLKSLFEFHSLWHLFTGYASYMTILFLIDCVYQKYSKENKLSSNHQVVRTKFFNLYYCLNDLTVVNETKRS